MRFTILLALALIGCAPNEAARCDIDVQTALRFSDDNADDTISARAIGPSCDKVVALYMISAPDGSPIWSWTSPMPRAFGDQFYRAAREEVEAFVTRWAEPYISGTAEAPAWAQRANNLPSGFHTSLDRATYEDIRARNLPMLCHLTSVARQTCIFWEPAAAGAGALYERDVIDEGEQPS